jgi:hypothetical protein
MIGSVVAAKMRRMSGVEGNSKGKFPMYTTM